LRQAGVFNVTGAAEGFDHFAEDGHGLFSGR
jgi:hypothetical protein